MWLINVQTYQLEDFVPEECPPYAILSHRWEEQEVLFYEMNNLGSAQQKIGFFKIQKTCEQALRDGIFYAWVDTCCIDKKSSAELSEAINSMFHWYKKAKICYVFLSDVKTSDPMSQEFGNSLWFTRGWTLQELIAPTELVFYNTAWVYCGHRRGLSWRLRTITGIEPSILDGEDHLADLHVATKMAWASKRKTTRREDVAYSLLGIFGVNMPLLYGEGDNAFRRLQQEIIRQVDDGTIFGWRSDSPGVSGLLAPSPQAFRNVAVVARGRGSPYDIRSNNRGIELTMYAILRSPQIYQVQSGCVDTMTSDMIVIFLRRQRPHDWQKGQEPYLRIHLPSSIYQVHNLELVFSQPGILIEPKWFYHDAVLRGLVFAITPPLGDHRVHSGLSSLPEARFNVEVVCGGQFESLFRPSHNMDMVPDIEVSANGRVASLGLYRYGKMLAFDSDHPEIECLMLGINFDGSLILIALAPLHSDVHVGNSKRKEIIDSLFTGIPNGDSELYQTHCGRSFDLSRMIWHRTRRSMGTWQLPYTDNCHVSFEGFSIPELSRSVVSNCYGPNDNGIWAFDAIDERFTFPIIALENNNLQIHLDFTSSNPDSGRSHVVIDVQRLNRQV